MGMLDGRRALVTGGASGLGAATARRFVEEGAEVVIADIDVAGGRRVAQELGGVFEELDVRDPAAWDEVVGRHPEVDIAMLNAGVATRTGDRPLDPASVVPLEDLTLADYERARGINLDGVVYGARALIPRLYRRGGGDILITASVAGLVAMTPDPIYGATKHAVVGFARALGESCAARGVHVCSINPGFADTNILGPDGAQNLRAMGIAVMDPSRVADAVMHAMTKRIPGAQWVVWADEPIRQYEWNPPV